MIEVSVAPQDYMQEDRTETAEVDTVSSTREHAEASYGNELHQTANQLQHRKYNIEMRLCCA